ncbi:formyltransferase family protein [Iodobacter fluviatilis]|uniref:formyltransferase family protein n=1 Tax=Iodobacter fluviatilis TaxID=537 RepID=UPI001CAA85B7|nr:formyltransferase family protein [Iodobacter fluviatilis]
MKILFITTAHNSLSQRLYVELTQKKHHINVLIAVDEEAMCNAVEKFKPELIICPMLKSAIPKQIWMQHVCLIVHPGIVGDRGASSLDWAIMEDCENWGVTILQAAEEMDAGDIWAYKSFKMRNASKSALYRLEVTEAAVVAVLEAVTNFESKSFIPTPLNYDNYSVRGTLRPSMKQSDRKIDWNESTEFISRKIRAADSFPGVIDTIYDEEYFLYGVYEEDFLKGIPGTIIGQREGAICIATGNGAV